MFGQAPLTNEVGYGLGVKLWTDHLELIFRLLAVSLLLQACQGSYS
jgi:hypothetical protein